MEMPQRPFAGRSLTGLTLAGLNPSFDGNASTAAVICKPFKTKNLHQKESHKFAIWQMNDRFFLSPQNYTFFGHIIKSFGGATVNLKSTSLPIILS